MSESIALKPFLAINFSSLHPVLGFIVSGSSCLFITKRAKDTTVSKTYRLNFVLFVLLYLKVCAACANLRGTKFLGFGNLSRQGAKARSSEGEEQYSYELFSLFFPTFAALASLREIFRISVAALPR
jgi:hypothetical protein